MSDLPKIVRDRLQAKAALDPHPEADLLTAFAEHSLSSVERESVVGHLSRCSDCREVVALGLLPIEEPVSDAVEAGGVALSAAKAARARRNWFAWPGLR